MQIYEKKMGRVFRLEFKEGDDLLAQISDFVRNKEIKEASLFIVGAIGAGQIVTGFINAKEGARRRLGQKREFFGLGNLTWPAKKPSSIKEPVPWDNPQPYAHFHLAFGPDVGEEQKEMLVGHLAKGIINPSATVLLYELL